MPELRDELRAREDEVVGASISEGGEELRHLDELIHALQPMRRLPDDRDGPAPEGRSGRDAVRGIPPSWSSIDDIERREGGRDAGRGIPPSWSSIDGLERASREAPRDLGATEPPRGLGARPEELASDRAARGRAVDRFERENGESLDALPIARAQRDVNRGAVALDRAIELATLNIVKGKRRRVRLTVRLEPRSGELVTARAILFGEHGVGRVARERVAKPELALTRVARGRLRDDDLVGLEPAEVLVEIGAVRQRRDAARPERAAEHSGRSQRASHLAREPREPRFDRRDDRGGELAVATVHVRSHELLEEKRVPARAPRDARDELGGGLVAERFAHEGLAAPLPERPQREGLQRATSPELWIGVRDLGARERDDDERGLLEDAQDMVDEAQ
ncbi:MAG: hypothetical protein U0271_44795 [Polyangiaceae bacterium]